MVKKMRVYEWLKRICTNLPENVAINFKNQIWKYKDLLLNVDATASYLQKKYKLKVGDRVVYYGPNNPEIIILILAASKIGIIIVPINWRLEITEITFLIHNSSPKLIIFDPVFKTNFKKFFEKNIDAIPIVNDDDYGFSFSERRKNYSDSYNVEGNNLDLLLVYTSGTTGKPKGAVLGQNSLICNALMSHHAHGMVLNDKVYVCLPLFHVGGINILLMPALLKGATVFLEDKFDKDKVVLTIKEKKITQIITVPTILSELIKNKFWNKINISSLKNISVGSTDVPIDLINEVHKNNIPVIQIYGATETSPLAIYQTPDIAFNSIGSIGKKGLHCSIKLVDQQLREVEEGNEGEILVKGENVLSYYWKDKDASVENIVDGWFRTGDIAYLDKNGLFWFQDRIKNVIISGGENIYPAELERILNSLEYINEFSIVGKKDKYWGEVPVIVLSNKNNIYSKEEILNYFIGKLAKYKIPKEVIFINELPKNALGKIKVSDVKQIVNETNF